MMRQKRERLDAFRQFYYRTLPDSLPAQRELRERVTAHLLADHPGSFERRGSLVRSLITGQALDLDDKSTEPLLQLSYLIEEDFMLLDEIEEFRESRPQRMPTPAPVAWRRRLAMMWMGA